MKAPEVKRAAAATTSMVSALGLRADDAVVLQNSNKLSLRVLPCDVFARVAHSGREVARLEVELAGRLAAAGSPVAALEPRVEPRVYRRDGFAITLWTYYASVRPPEGARTAYAAYADALERLHSGMRELDLEVPHFTDRVEEARQLVASRDQTPALDDEDRALLADTLATRRKAIGERGAVEQLLHGEPHPGNLLHTETGPRFIDLETCCRGPIEFDLAHAPEEVGEHYPGVDPDLHRDCRILMHAMVAAWRWDRDDQLPNGRQMAIEKLSEIRRALDR